MNEDLKSKVNSIAEKAYELKTAGNRSGYKTEHNKIAALLLEESEKYVPTKVNSEDYFGCVGEVIVECLNKWEPGKHGFYECYLHRLRLRLNDIYSNNLDTLERGARNKLKKEMKENPELSEEEKAACKPDLIRDDSYNAPDEDNKVKLVSSDENIEDDVLQADNIKKHFDVLNKVIMTQKKKYENSTKICYAPYFYTEFVTERIHKEHDPSVYQKSESGLMKTIDHDFISYYMDGENNSISEISNGRLKKLSSFSGNPKDDRPCGYQIENIVYAKYISMLKRLDKLQSDSSISQQRTKFMQLIKLEWAKSLNE